MDISLLVYDMYAEKNLVKVPDGLFKGDWTYIYFIEHLVEHVDIGVPF